MGISRLFRRSTFEEVCSDIAIEVEIASFHYCKSKATHGDCLAAHAGAEIAYLLLHVADQRIRAMLGHTGRCEARSLVYQDTIYRYSENVLKDSNSEEVKTKVRGQMRNTLAARQAIYAQCRSFMGEYGQWPGFGTKVCVLSYYVCRALGMSHRDNMEPILLGKQKPSLSDMDDLPDPIETLKIATTIVSYIKNTKLDAHTRRLCGSRGRDKRRAESAA